MSSPASPLAAPQAWNLVAPGYAADIVPVFERFAEEALRLASPHPGARVLDVAAGPGTLALIAARAARVSAIDFSPPMIELLRDRAARAGVEVDARVGDGMELPYADRTFDASFSMFGLMFFPDRARGFRELHRVLVPKGRAVISSWPPMDRSPVLSEFFRALEAGLPGLPLGGGGQPLSNPESIRSEMAEAGFASIEVEEVTRGLEASPREFVDSARRSNAAFVMLGEKLGADAFARLADSIRERLVERFGEGPMRIDMPAFVAVGRRP